MDLELILRDDGGLELEGSTGDGEKWLDSVGF